MSIEEWQQMCPNGFFACHVIHNKQCGIVRFNCADSLDRTNIATFCKLKAHFYIPVPNNNKKKFFRYN